MTDDLTSQLSTGLTIKIYGTDAETPDRPVREGGGHREQHRGLCQNATNGLGAGDSTIILQVDRDKGARLRPDRCAGLPADRRKADHHHHGTDPVAVDGSTMNVRDQRTIWTR